MAFLPVIGLLLAIGFFAMNALSSVRGFVSGEGLWSKSQKSAVHYLTKYAYSEEEADFQRYRPFLRVPLADRRARLELEKPDSDLEAADRAFVEGRNHPDDVRGMSLLFKRFRDISYMDRAVAVWAKADTRIEELEREADDLHASVAEGPLSDTARRRHLSRIDVTNDQLTALEDEFSFALGEAARFLKDVIVTVTVIATGVSLTFGVYVSYAVSAQILSSVARLEGGATRVGAGDFEQRIVVDSNDELGQLADHFNQMTDNLLQSREERWGAARDLALRARELEVANHKLRENELTKNELFANISHELRTPLSLILAPLDSLLDGDYGSLPAPALASLGTVHNNAVRLLQIVQGLLDFERIEVGRLVVSREPTDIVALTRSIVADFESLMAKRGIHGAIEVSPGGSARVQMDRYLYERILFNLLSNAVKFTPEGGDVSVALRVANDRITVSVKDTGIGIRDEDQAHVFERFRQLEGAATRQYDGTGLGLALVKEFAALLGGAVTIASRLGAGSTFTVECDAPHTDDDASPAPSSRRHDVEHRGITDEGGGDGGASGARPFERRGKILIAEDNAELAKYIADRLSALGEIRIAADGEEALALVREWMPTLVVADVMMPKRDGLSVCRELKADPETRGIPFVLLTALTCRGAMLQGWEAGADDYLFKPFHPTELITRVRTLLAARLALLDHVRAKREAELALRVTMGQLAEAQEIAHVGSWDWDIATNRLTWSDELYRMFGVEPGQSPATPDDYLARVHPDDRDMVRDAIKRVYTGKQPFSIEHRVVWVNGDVRWIQGRGRAFVDDRGDPVRMAGTAHDITDRQRAEESRVRLVEVLVSRNVAEAARERTALLAEASALLGTSLDCKQSLSQMARFVLPRLGDWCAFDILGQTGIEAVTEGETDAARALDAQEIREHFRANAEEAERIERVRQTGHAELHSDLLLRADGSNGGGAAGTRAERTLNTMIVPIVVRGETLGTIVFAASSGQRYTPADLETAKELGRRAGLALDNARLYESEQSARQVADGANRAMDDFLGTVSHELRTPLNAMLGWTRMLRSGDLSEKENQRALETIERNAENQAQLIEDLLDVSRIISGKLKLDIQTVQLVDVVERALDTVRLSGESRNISITSSLDSSVGLVVGDPHRLQQVIWNLLSNAIKFTPKGGRVDVVLERSGENAKIDIADTGKGIRPDFLPHVFERFKQAESSTTRAHGGLGIGLAISRHIVERHGGTIEAHSGGDGRGATFTVFLALAEDAKESSGTWSIRAGSSPSMSKLEVQPELKDLKVLIVDDEPDSRDLLAAVLQRCGAITRVAASVGEALTQIRRDKPDVLVSDIGMPGQDGYDLIRQVRSLKRDEGGDIPAAALTAYARVADRRKALSAGFTMHLAKPIEPVELIAVVAGLARFGPRIDPPG